LAAFQSLDVRNQFLQVAIREMKGPAPAVRRPGADSYIDALTHRWPMDESKAPRLADGARIAENFGFVDS
jgi:hypothetical protein